MDHHPNLFHVIGDWWDHRQAKRRAATFLPPSPRLSRWLPTRGNVLFTLLIVALLLWAQTAGALPLFSSQSAANTSQSTIAYQGRLADVDGNPITKQVSMTFRLYAQDEGGIPLWEEPWIGSSGVNVSDGLFNIMLGSLKPIPSSVISGNDTLFLGITVDTDDEMIPRVQLGTVPFAVQALTVPDGSVTTAKIADGAVTQAKAPRLVSTQTENTILVHGSATATVRENNRRWGYANISLQGKGFSQPPTTLCSTSGPAGFKWNCHVEYETANSFGIWIERIDGATDWTAVPVRWIAIGN